MPHLNVEYSANLKGTIDFQDLFKQLHDYLVRSGIFPLAGIRSRALCLEEYRIADGQSDYAFVHILLKIGAGRELTVREGIGAELFALISNFFQQTQQQRLLALSFEIAELHPVLSYKSNNIHAFLQQHEQVLDQE